MKLSSLSLLLVSLASAQADFTLVRDHRASCRILQNPGASEPEKFALHEFTNYLHQITGAEFTVADSMSDEKEPAIIIGPGPLTGKYFPEVDRLESEECVIRVKGNKLLLTGGPPRGTIYAVNRYLHEQAGVRWWTPWATNVPKRATFTIPNLNVREKPAFAYRGPYWYPAFNPNWSVHNEVNFEMGNMPPQWGGRIIYKGFCHTFNALVPPAKHFGEHPEWFSLINGKRTHENAQLCLTNPKLRDFVVQRVKEWLRESPDCEIISVTQNDCFGFCECPSCKAIDDAEQSHSGTMLTFANYIGEQIEKEFPKVWVDTFAYQYTRTPPKTLKARPNVIVRLCSIECNFRESFDHASNASFADDIKKWSRICNNLYVWDYTTDFKNYVHPHPNWFVLGDDARFFQRYGVAGFFSEGAYASHGSEMAEMRAWVLAQLMWNPQQDDRELIREFLAGYYGEAAAKPIYNYLQLLHVGSKDFFLGCYLRKDPPPYLNFPSVNRAERLWLEAEKAVNADPEKLLRIRIAHLPLRCSVLRHWSQLRRECWEQNETWPFPESRKAVAEEFRNVCQGVPDKDWTHVRVMSEGGLTVESFLQPFAEDPPLEKIKTPAPARLKNAPPPADLPDVNPVQCFDLQDNVAALYKPGHFAELLPDENASDRRACWMPGNHAEWAFRISGRNIPRGNWKMYAVVRVKTENVTKTDAVAFTAGVYDDIKKEYPAQIAAKVGDTREQYRSYYVGNFEANPQRDVWVAPANNPEVKAVWVDRIYLVP